MSGIIGGISKKIEPYLRARYRGLLGVGHPGDEIAPLLTRQRIISEEELLKENDHRHVNRFLIASEKKKK